MRETMRLPGILLLVMSAVSTATGKPTITSANPDPDAPIERRSGLHLTDIPLHDPWIVPDPATHTYYLYTGASPAMTGQHAGGTFLYKSTDLRSWDGPFTVFLIPNDSWADPLLRAWAPEVHPYKGRFYLFTTLHNPQRTLPSLMPTRPQFMRGTVIAVSDSLDGPFSMVRKDAPIAPANFMTLDGTLYLDRKGDPWMVYAHEWLQKTDGTIEALPLARDLSAATGDPLVMFKASDAPWLDSQAVPSADAAYYVTDGPELYRTRTGRLLMLWATYEKSAAGNDSYVQALARSRSGELAGPWEQLPPLVRNDSGHGMLFHTFEGRLMLVVHQPYLNARGKIYEIDDRGDDLKVRRYRADLSGPELGPQPGQPHHRPTSMAPIPTVGAAAQP
jgi:beta-xylosidase